MKLKSTTISRGAMLVATAVLGVSTLLPTGAGAAECVKGVYRAGCAGPNGAVAVAKPPAVVHPPGTIKCADGIYRAGCTGPNGTAVVRRRY